MHLFYAIVLEMLIQGLLRLTNFLPLVCQLKVLLPWMLLITWHHSEFCSTKKRNPHLDNNVRFFCFSLPKLRPPSLCDLTKSHFAKRFNFSRAWFQNALYISKLWRDEKGSPTLMVFGGQGIRYKLAALFIKQPTVAKPKRRGAPFECTSF